MDDSFFIYLERIEFMIFFSGYLLIYLLVLTVSETKWAKRIFKMNMSLLLPYAYATVGILYLGLQLKNLYPDYSPEHIRSFTTMPFPKIWGLSSILFLIPLLAKKPVLSALHSLVFFYFIVMDLARNLFQPTESSVLKNDMNIYTYSLFINLSAFIFIALVYFIYTKISNRKIH